MLCVCFKNTNCKGEIMTKILENIYKIEIPLPNSPLKVLNCHIICSDERNLMIDTGFNNEESYKAMMTALGELNISLDKTDIFLTHLHSDHAGLACKLQTENNKIYISDVDGKRVNAFTTKEYWENLSEMQNIMGFPADERLSYDMHPGYKNRVDKPIDYIAVEKGQIFKIGEYEFEAIDLMGHTPGQMGLYEKNHKILFSGDHILNRISPNINLWDFEQDYLGAFLQNLKKVDEMQVDVIYSSHRTVIDQPKQRISELLEHHKTRLEIIINLIKEGKSTVFDITNGVKWDFGTGKFCDFPVPQKWFATLEVFAHVEHLRRKGFIKLAEENGIYKYFI